MERIPKTGEFYRHFKNKLYQVITIAEHSETGESMVVYQALYGDYRTYVRPMDMFVSKVDPIKYPEVTQTYRFEKVSFEAGREEEIVVVQKKEPEKEPEKDLNPHLVSFIEAETYEQRLESLSMLRGKIGQEEMNIIYGCLDMREVPGELEDQMDAAKRHLSIKFRYERGHRGD